MNKQGEQKINYAFVIQMFWAYGELSNLEKLCINSFLAHGCQINLWTYGEIRNVPSGVTVKNARQFLPESRVFKYKNGSYAGFANLFRYAMISRIGGLYVDTDVICLNLSNIVPSEPFLVTERIQQSVQLKINNNVIYSPNPRSGDIIDLAFGFADRFPMEHLDWGDCGPKLLTAIVASYPKLSFEIKGPNFANSVDWWDCPHKLLDSNFSIPEGAAFLHCYNDTWRRAGIDKNSKFPKGSLMGLFADKYI